ncbi:MAG: hypothetical protein NTW86_32655, partial [Candidatus Sumerlaeota bacterium]|nr:hypothetical protein [Candidatus Sumerlaeota bacterium]
MSTRPADYTFYRRYLPHWQPDGAILFVSFRLAGSLPRPVLDRLRREKTQLDSAAPRPNETPAKQRLRIRKRLFALTDEALAAEIREGLNAGWKAGATVAPAFQPGVMEKRLWLGDPRVAEIVRGSLVFWDGKWFR